MTSYIDMLMAIVVVGLLAIGQPSGQARPKAFIPAVEIYTLAVEGLGGDLTTDDLVFGIEIPSLAERACWPRGPMTSASDMVHISVAEIDEAGIGSTTFEIRVRRPDAPGVLYIRPSNYDAATVGVILDPVNPVSITIVDQNDDEHHARFESMLATWEMP